MKRSLPTLIILLAQILFVWQGTVFASEWDFHNGLLDDQALTTTNLPAKTYDNDISDQSAVNLGEKFTYYIDFAHPVNIYGMYLYGGSVYSTGIKVVFASGDTHYEYIPGPGDDIYGKYFQLNYQSVVRIEIIRSTFGKYVLREIDFFGEVYTDEEPPGEVKDLSAEAGDGEVTLRYTFPPDSDFSYVRIYKDGDLVANNVKATSYKVTGLTNGIKYTFRVTTVDKSGNESDGVTITATPQEPGREITQLKATAKHDRVDLSWQNPKRADFELVRIYRKEIAETGLRFLPVAHAEDDYKELFETNGTFFRDMTVEPETSYEYKLTTVTGGQESVGVTVQVTTPPIPPPSTGGTTIIRHENGDVTVRWTPQPGKMIIEIDGAEYTRVDAQLGEYTIPAADIPVDEHGRPAEIRLIPVAPNGDTGTPIVINPGGWLIALPFGAKELLEAGIDLLAVFGPIILLVLVLWYVRPIMRLLRQSARGRART